jgi:hypothetical protein
LGVGVPLAEIELKENVEPCSTGILAGTRHEKAFGIKIVGARETVLEADTKELWIAFGQRNHQERAEIVFWTYGEKMDKSSDGGNVTLESTQEDRMNNLRV